MQIVVDAGIGMLGSVVVAPSSFKTFVDDHSSKNQSVGRILSPCKEGGANSGVLLPRGGISFIARSRLQLALTLAEREDISRGIASGWSLREVARHFRVQAATFRVRIWLPSDPIALGARVVSIVAAFNAARPANARFSVDTLSAIQPATMSGACEGVHTRLVHGDCTAGHSDEHEISVRCVIPRAASYGTAVIRRFVTRICIGACRFVLHDM